MSPESQTSGDLTGSHSRIRRWLEPIGRFLFRHRSYTPIPLAVLVIWQSRVTPVTALAGLVLLAMGEVIRLWAVRDAGGRTRTRKVGADGLVTWGTFAHTRNPIYIGNLLVWTGVVCFAGGSYLPWLLLATWLFFLLQYALIVSVEETTLAELFGSAYETYRRAVPRIWPRWRRPGAEAAIATSPPENSRYSWRNVLRWERSTLEAILLTLTLSLFSTVLKG
jgi:protein-S-isoprenylcysteine O-methyltransferase Ste14